MGIEPPDNPRSWDHCLIVVETGGMRIVHWGDNRHDPPPEIWEALGRIDVALLPVDDSQHVMGFAMTEHIIETLRPHVVIPQHLDRAVHFFGDHVAFDKEAWFRDGR